MRSKPETLTYAKHAHRCSQCSISTVLLFAQTQPVNATIDASKTAAPISKYIYGQFLEHAGNLVNEGVWAEMLEDRKFYYPITSQPPEEPPTPPWRRRGPLRHWTPMVADEFVIMDSENPYTGDHSPLGKTRQNGTAWIHAVWPGRAKRESLHGQDRSRRQPDSDGESDAGLGQRSRRPADGNDSRARLHLP